MADIGQEVAFRVTQTGAEQVAQSLEGVANATNKAGQSTSKWTGFIREQRMENRQQNFVLRESAQAITTLSFATIALTGSTGGASKEVQNLSRSLLAGVASFQGADFAIAGLGRAMGFTPGGVGLAISGVLGLGTALYAFLDGTAERAKNAAEQMRGFAENAKQFAEGIGGKEAKRELTGIDAVIAGSEKRLRGLKEYQTLNQGLGMSAVGKRILEGLGVTKDNFGDMIMQEEKLIAAYRLRRAALLDIIAAEEQLAAVEQRKKGVRTEELGGLYGPNFMAGRLTQESWKDISGGKGLPGGRVGFSDMKPVKLDETFSFVKFIEKELDKTNIAQLQFISLLDQSVGTLRSAVSFLGASTDSFIGKLLQGLDIAMSIMRLIQGFQSVGAIAGLLSGNPAGALVAGYRFLGRKQLVETVEEVYRLRKD